MLDAWTRREPATPRRDLVTRALQAIHGVDLNPYAVAIARFRFPGGPVEVMGGLELHADEGWRPVRPGKLVLAGVNGLAVPVPSVEDQIRLCESFGRPKDLQRAALLKQLSEEWP